MSEPTPNPMPENIDYAHTSNVSRLHAAAARERKVPDAKPTPLPLAIVAGVVVLALFAGAFWGANSEGDLSAANIKGYDYKAKYHIDQALGTSEPDPVEQHQPANWIAAGKAVYNSTGTCGSCHGANGEGQAGKYPPLKDSEFVIKGETQLVAILLHGVTGALTVNGKGYNDTMQPLGTTILNDKQLAQVLSYIRNEWGNKASIVYEDQIKVLRKELGNRPMYNEQELRAIGPDKNAPPSEWPAKLLAGGAATAAAPAPAAAGGAPAPAPAAPPAK